MGIISDLTTLITKQATLTSNKVANFCYDSTAYANDDADGVETYDYTQNQNIPKGSATVLVTNSTILDKGYRSQGSSLARMIVNHFFGRTSYNLNKVNDVVASLLSSFKNAIGTANGIASLDSDGRIPFSQLPESSMELKGHFDASTGVATLLDGTEVTLENGATINTNGDFYICNVAGTYDFGDGDISFLVNDRVLCYGTGTQSTFGRLSAGDVRSVNNKTPTGGNVTLTGADINVSGSDTTKLSESALKSKDNTFAGNNTFNGSQGGTRYSKQTFINNASPSSSEGAIRVVTPSGLVSAGARSQINFENESNSAHSLFLDSNDEMGLREYSSIGVTDFFKLHGYTSASGSRNANNMVVPGVFHTDGNQPWSNLPPNGSSWGVLFVFKTNADDIPAITQLYWDCFDPSYTLWKRCNFNNVWTTWIALDNNYKLNTEIPIGFWHDGSVIYRRVIHLNTLSTTPQQISLTGVQTVIRCDASGLQNGIRRCNAHPNTPYNLGLVAHYNTSIDCVEVVAYTVACTDVDIILEYTKPPY